jgi:hypothetical protein
MQTNTDYPFTKEEFVLLTEEQKSIIDAVAEFLTGSNLSQIEDLDNESFSEYFALLKPCDGCVPWDQIGDDLHVTIRKKFKAIYEVATELAEKELHQKGLKQLEDFNFCLLIQPDYEDCTHVAILDYKRPVCYLHEWTKAWNFHFDSFVKIAGEVIRIKHLLVSKVTEKHPIYIRVQEGIVHEVVNIPANTEVIVLDYDLEGFEANGIEISPLDGEACYIERF